MDSPVNLCGGETEQTFPFLLVLKEAWLGYEIGIPFSETWTELDEKNPLR